MKKTQLWKLLLFSFFFLFCCFPPVQKRLPHYKSSHCKGNGICYTMLQKKDFSETYRSGSLYYIALAQTERGDDASALRSLDLYQEITKEEGASTAARNLMLILADRTGDAGLVVQQAAVLDEAGMLGMQGARAYYQALMTLGRLRKQAWCLQPTSGSSWMIESMHSCYWKRRHLWKR